MNKKMFKIIGIILIILIMLALLHAVRNFLIITEMQNKVGKYISSENYHMSLISKVENGVTVTTNYFKKSNKELVIIERNKDNENIKMSMYNNGERIDRFIETADSKTVTLNAAKSMAIGINDMLKTENKWQNFIYGIPTIITNVKYNGKDCYKVTNFLSPYSLYEYDSKRNDLYIEKETGLCLGSYTNTENKYDYEFDNVDDSVFNEPDIGQYTLNEE